MCHELYIYIYIWFDCRSILNNTLHWNLQLILKQSAFELKRDYISKEFSILRKDKVALHSRSALIRSACLTQWCNVYWQFLLWFFEVVSVENLDNTFQCSTTVLPTSVLCTSLCALLLSRNWMPRSFRGKYSGQPCTGPLQLITENWVGYWRDRSLPHADGTVLSAHKIKSLIFIRTYGNHFNNFNFDNEASDYRLIRS